MNNGGLVLIIMAAVIFICGCSDEYMVQVNSTGGNGTGNTTINNYQTGVYLLNSNDSYILLNATNGSIQIGFNSSALPSSSSSNSWNYTPVIFTNTIVNGSFSVLNSSISNATFLYVNQTTGNVGIKTTTPGSDLEIGSNDASLLGNRQFRLDSSIQSAYFTITTGGTYTLFTSNLNQNLNFQSNGATGYMTFWAGNLQRMKINYDGNVGIGTDAPTGKLNVNGSVNITGDTYNYGNLTFAPALPSGLGHVELNTRKQEVFFDDMNYAPAAYNRVTTAPTTAIEAQIPSVLSFPSAASAGGDGGYIMKGDVGTASAIINTSKVDNIAIRARLLTTATRADIIGAYKSGTTLTMNTAKTGVFFWYNVTTSANWWGYLCNTGVCTTFDTGKTADTNWHTFEILGNNEANGNLNTNYTFYYDNAYVGTFAAVTNFPTTLVSNIGTWSESQTTSSATTNIDWVYAEIKR